MKHLGDITKVHGDQIEPVDCITFGSPCQDLSIAGRRAGLAGERSGLFMEAVRVIKEMRSSTNGLYPTFAVWENVPGAFSSNGGEDFRAVLEELARVEQPDASIPRPRVGGAGGAKPEQSPETDGLWLGDSLMLNIGESPREESVSLLSQILEVNVPQKYFLSARACQGILTRASRRGKPLPEVLRQALMDVIGGGDSYTLKIRSGCAGGGKGALVQTEKSATLSTLQDQTLFQPIHVLNDQGGNVMDVSYDVTGTLRAQEHGHQPIVFDARGNGDGKIVPTITGDHENRITDYTAIAIERKTFNEQSFSHYKESGKCSTLKAKAGNIGNGSECLIAEKHDSSKVDGVQTKPFCAGFSYKAGAKAMGIGYEIEKAGTLSAERHDSAVLEKTIRWIVRRLTPVECERLQGFPDNYTNIGDWTDSKGKKHKYADSPRYKALGNSIALPQWFWLVQRMRPYLKEKPTLGSLFDGLGGFPLVWQRAYGKGTARWASEIESFCVAVTKRRFGEE
jgi:DNA (cytosine-5)-methyltransferase 1